MTGMAVVSLPGSVGRSILRQNHYSKSCHNGPMCFGLTHNDALVGVVAFSTPCSENVCRSVFGAGYERRVIELSRLWLDDYLPSNTASWFVSRP